MDRLLDIVDDTVHGFCFDVREGQEQKVVQLSEVYDYVPWSKEELLQEIFV